MHCHFIRDGHIQQTMDLPHLSAGEAIDQSRKAFEAYPELFDRFEVWDEARLIYQEDRISRPSPD
jgi:hypothetical protein